MMDFLYFPEDKTEYIPSAIFMAVFMIGAVLTLYFFYKVSKKQEKAFNEKYHLEENASGDKDKKN